MHVSKCFCVSVWMQIWNLLRDRVKTKEERLAKAAKVREKVLLLRDKLLESGSMLTPNWFTPYLHVLIIHVPQQIQHFPFDLMDLSGSGIEHVNKETKKIERYGF